MARESGSHAHGLRKPSGGLTRGSSAHGLACVGGHGRGEGEDQGQGRSVLRVAPRFRRDAVSATRGCIRNTMTPARETDAGAELFFPAETW